MKKLTFIVIITFLVPRVTYSQNTDLRWLNRWFDAWRLVSGDLFALPPGAPPEMVFYDDTYVYSTATITAAEGEPFEGPGLYGRRLPWRKMQHRDTLTLPDGQRVPVGLMSFAAATKEGNSFFVMAAPAFWKSAGIESSELSLEKMLTGVFLHEFTHTRQYNGFGMQVDSIERAYTFNEVPLSDDIVQGYFKKDSDYVRSFQEETAAFYGAAFATSKEEARALTAKGIALLKTRQAKYFTGNKNILKKLDDIFLSMEGLGQYAGVYWLAHPRGGNMDITAAVNGFRRKRNQWSQEEGLAMFLALIRLAEPGWTKDQFGARPVTIITLLEGMK